MGARAALGREMGDFGGRFGQASRGTGWACTSIPLVAPLDRLRAQFFAHFGRALAPWLQSRPLRVATLGVVLTGGCFALAISAPVLMLAFAPLVWGVPHLLADVRNLVIRQNLHKAKSFAVITAIAVLAGGGAGFGVRATLLGCVAVVLLAQRATPRRRVGVGLLAAVLTTLAMWQPWWADWALAHAHNYVAAAIWLGWRQRSRWWHALPLAALGAGTVAIGSGATTAWSLHTNYAPSVAGLDLATFSETLAPLADPALAVRLVVLYAFAQGFHYVVWLHLMPNDDRVRPVHRSFRASARELVRDLGALPLALTLAAAIGFGAWALADVVAARDRYFQLAWFHGHLELLCGTWLLLFGVRRAQL